MTAPAPTPASRRPPTPTEVSDGPPRWLSGALAIEHATPCAGFPWTQNVSVATTVSTLEFTGFVAVIVVVVVLARRVEVTVVVLAGRVEVTVDVTV
jgi:hypothetical protein